jgi:hypothetical protein
MLPCILPLWIRTHRGGYRAAYRNSHDITSKFGFAVCIVLHRSRFVSCRIIPYCTPQRNTVQTADRMYNCKCTVRVLPYMYVLYCIVLYFIVGSRAVRIVSCRIVSYCASGRTVPTLSSEHVVLSRIVSRFHSRGSCSDRIPGLYHDFTRAVLY